jgi:hypothetical protein
MEVYLTWYRRLKSIRSDGHIWKGLRAASECGRKIERQQVHGEDKNTAGNLIL